MARQYKVSDGITKERYEEITNLDYFSEEKKEQSYPSHDTGAMREKLDNLRYDYIPAKIVNEAYARVATFGAKKYDTDNWRKGLPQSQISESLQRHLWAYFEGEDIDPESGLSHLDHVLWNAVALVFNENHPTADKGFMDDRFEVRKQKSQ